MTARLKGAMVGHTHSTLTHRAFVWFFLRRAGSFAFEVNWIKSEAARADSI